MDNYLSHAGKVINLSWNIQVSCSLLELWRRHVVMLQEKVLHVANIRQPVGNFLESFTIWIFFKLETSSDCSREFPDTSCSSVADGSRQNGSPFLRNGVGTLRIEEDSRFGASSLDAGCTRGISSSFSSSGTVVWSGRTRSLSFSSSSSSWARAGYADFRWEKVKVTGFVGRADRSRDFGWYARLVKSNTVCSIVEYSIGEEYKPKSRTCNPSSLWIWFKSNTQILHLRGRIG